MTAIHPVPAPTEAFDRRWTRERLLAVVVWFGLHYGLMPLRKPR